MKCKICTQHNTAIFTSKILYKYEIEYFYCNHCGFLQTEEPYWLNEAYSDSINNSDVGYMERNKTISQNLITILSLFFNKKSKFLDYAGGYGVLTRMMRDIGFDFYWDDKYTTNLFSKGFEYNKTLTIEAVTTFESFEHFVEPIEELEKLLSISKNIIFSTELLPVIIPKPEEWSYYGLDHGQHISFYSQKTLDFLANKYNLNYIYLDGLHIFTVKQISRPKLLLVKLKKYGLKKIYKKLLKSKISQDYTSIVSRK